MQTHISPFGMLMPGRDYNAGTQYRYGFNGKEQDNEVSGQGNQYDYGFRIYNPRLGRFLSVDPLTNSYPWWTPYQFAGNTPIQAIDLDGAEPKGLRWDNPYTASHPGTGVKQLACSWCDGQVFIRNGRQTNVYTIEDIDKKTYLIFETATGDKQLEYIEYDKDGYKGDVNNDTKSFEWSTIPDPSDLLTLLTVGPLVLIPGAIEYGGALLYKLYKIAKKQTQNNTDKEEVQHKEETTKTTNEKQKYSKKEAREAAKKKREEQPASEDYVKKYRAKELEKNKGKDARRQAHDKKEKGQGDRSKKEIDEDYE